LEYAGNPLFETGSCINNPLPTWVIHAKFDLLENWASRVQPLKSLKVIGTDTDRSGIDDFLLMFHSNYGTILYPFHEIARYLPKIENFSEPMFT